MNPVTVIGPFTIVGNSSPIWVSSKYRGVAPLIGSFAYKLKIFSNSASLYTLPF